ncbi:ras-related protein RABE1c isoform X2 [Quercus suber]|uniref:ras-related protein RABE1c isoform X2 n=1 Tax=Quercus suber TaxID=58331 RepID=UPI0032DFD8A7
MAAPPAKARADYDYLIKLLLIGDSGRVSWIPSLDLLIMDSPNVWARVVCFCAFLMVPSQPVLLPPLAYYRGAMGILLVYDVTDESSFNNIKNWIRNIEQHASDNVNKILVGNKADMDESKRAVPTSKGQALADEYGIKFFETSAKTNLNVEEVFFSIARDIKRRLAETDSKVEPQTLKINKPDQTQNGGQATQRSSCCGS